jgi:hypothetical protein
MAFSSAFSNSLWLPLLNSLYGVRYSRTNRYTRVYSVLCKGNTYNTDTSPSSPVRPRLHISSVSLPSGSECGHLMGCWHVPADRSGPRLQSGITPSLPPFRASNMALG